MKLGFLSTLQTVGTLTTKIAIVAAASIGGTALVSSSVFATLTATANNATATTVSSGQMSLTLASGSATGSGSASGGFSTGISAMAPLDSVVRLVTLTNASTLNSASMTLRVADSTSTLLTSDAVNGLKVYIQQCSVAWGQVSAGSAYTCTSPTDVIGTSGTPMPIATLISGVQTMNMASLSALAGAFLKVTISLPDSSEVTPNGVVPAGIQNKSAALTWTITATQRTQSTTNS